MKKIKWELSLIIIVALWGLSFSLTKPLLSKMGVFNFLAYRFVIGGGILMIILAITKNIKLSKEVIKSGITSGILLFAAFYCHMEGLKFTSISKNAFLVGSSVVFIPIAVYMIKKEKSSRLTLIQMVISLVGLGMITLISSRGGLNYGDVITAIGSLIYAFYTVLAEKSVRQHHVGTFTGIQLSTVGILSLGSTLAFEEVTTQFSGFEWLTILFLAVVLTGIFYGILGMVQKNLSAASVCVIFTLEPFFATIFGWVLFGEIITLTTVTGGLLILIAVLLPYMNINKPYNKIVMTDDIT